MKRRAWGILGALIVVGLVVAGVLYRTFPVQMTTYGGMSLNYLKTLSTPAGTVPRRPIQPTRRRLRPRRHPLWPMPHGQMRRPGDWPSYNRTPTSQRFSPLDQINAKNVGNLKVLCTYDLGTITAFESGLIMVNNALIGTAEFDIFSINPATCARTGARTWILPDRCYRPTAVPPIWTACCFEARRTAACSPSISRPARNCGRR